MEEQSQEEQLKGEANSLPQIARTLRITDQASYDVAASELRDVVTMRAKIIEHHREMKQKAHLAHQAVCDAEKKLLEPVAQAEVILKRLIANYESSMLLIQQHKEREARALALERENEERRKIQVELEEQARVQMSTMLENAATLEEAEAILQQTPVAVEAAAVQAAATLLPPQIIEVEPVMRRARGIGTTTSYSVSIEDMKELCHAIANGEFPDSFVLPNFAALNKYAGATMGKMKIPGCTVVRGTGVSARKR